MGGGCLLNKKMHNEEVEMGKGKEGLSTRS